jgi:hypothetical protein
MGLCFMIFYYLQTLVNKLLTGHIPLNRLTVCIYSRVLIKK